jgi:hypothetical protein
MSRSSVQARVEVLYGCGQRHRTLHAEVGSGAEGDGAVSLPLVLSGAHDTSASHVSPWTHISPSLWGLCGSGWPVCEGCELRPPPQAVPPLSLPSPASLSHRHPTRSLPVAAFPESPALTLAGPQAVVSQNWEPELCLQ